MKESTIQKSFGSAKIAMDAKERLTDRGALETWDYVAITFYFILVLSAGFAALFRRNRGTVSGYFLAGRFMWWLPVGASLFASNIGSEHFIGLAGSGAAAGLGVGAFEVNAILLLQLLGWLFLPVFIASGVSTLPQYMRKRFGGDRIRIYLAFLSLVLYIFTKISVNLYAGALFIRLALGWNLYLSIFFLLFCTAICTVTGGLAAVIYTDTLQTFIMIIGSVFLTVISFKEVGGYEKMLIKYGEAIATIPLNSTVPSKCAQPPENYDKMLREVTDQEMPWLGFLIGQTPASIWYWCSDQMMVQRTLAAKSLSHAQGATIFAGYLKILPFFIMVLPGMIARILFTEDIACADPDTCEQVCGSPTGCTNMAYPYLVLRLMPTGLKGVMMAVMLAALMSDLTSIFNSASTLFTIDIYGKIRKSVSVRELMIVGRLFVVFMIVISVVWIPVIETMQGGQLYLYIQSIAAYLAPPIAAVYLLAILWPRINERGAFYGLMAGMVVSIPRMVLDFVYPAPPCGDPDPRPVITANFHYMYFAVFLFWTTTLTAIGVSYLTDPPSEARLIRTTFWTRHDTRKREDENENLETMRDDECPEYVGTSMITMGEEDDNTKRVENGLTKSGEASSLPGPLPPRNGDVSENRRHDSPSLPYQFVHFMTNSLRRLASWFCGLDALDAEYLAQQEERLIKISSLQQDSRAKLFLTVNVCLIVLIGIFMFVFFSVPQLQLIGTW